MSFGIGNLSQINESANATGYNISETAGLFADNIPAAAFGSLEIMGIFILGALLIGLFKADVSIDSSIVFVAPTTFILGNYGMLPGGSGTLYGFTLALGAILALGITRYFSR